MTYTLIDYTREFHCISKRLNLSASTRSVYTAIVGEMNEAHYPERLSLTDRQLMMLAGLRSVATVHEAKNVLKNYGLIDFSRVGHGVTSYCLLTTHLDLRVRPGVTSYCLLTAHLDRTKTARSANKECELGEQKRGVPKGYVREDARPDETTQQARGGERNVRYSGNEPFFAAEYGESDSGGE